MPSSNDTFNSKTTTPFERLRAPRDTFDTRATTPFDRVRRESPRSKPEMVHAETRRSPGWAVAIAFLGVAVAAVILQFVMGF